MSSGTESHSKEGGVGSSTLLPQTGGGYGFHLNTSAPVTRRASPQQINMLEVLHFYLKQEGVTGFHWKRCTPVTTRASSQQTNTLEVLHFYLKQEGVTSFTGRGVHP